MLYAPETLFFSSSYQYTVFKNSRGRVCVVRVEAEDDKSIESFIKKSNLEIISGCLSWDSK